MLNIHLFERTKIKYISNTESILHYTIHIASIYRLRDLPLIAVGKKCVIRKI